MCLSVVHLRFRKYIVIFWLLAFEFICLFDHRLQVDLFQCHINATPATHWADLIFSIVLRYSSVLVFMCVLKQIRSIFSLLLRISFQKCITYQSEVTWALATTTTKSCPMSYSIRIRRIRKSKWSIKLSKWLFLKLKCDESEYILIRKNTLMINYWDEIRGKKDDGGFVEMNF